MDLRCWRCGVEPDDYAEITTYGDTDRQFIPTRWPTGDHEHSSVPPSPSQLAADGDRAMARIGALWGS